MRELNRNKITEYCLYHSIEEIEKWDSKLADIMEDYFIKLKQREKEIENK